MSPCPPSTTSSLYEEEEEEEEEEQHPQVVRKSRVRDAHGRSWCRVVGPAGVYWWMIGTSTAQYTSRRGSPPGQGGIQILAIVVALVGDVPVTMQRQFPASSSSSCLRSSSSTEWWTFQICYGYRCRKLWRFRSCRWGRAVLCSTVDTYSASARETFGIISGFLRELARSAPEVNSRPALLFSGVEVATLVVDPGSGLFSTGFAGIDAPSAVFRRLPSRRMEKCAHSMLRRAVLPRDLDNISMSPLYFCSLFRSRRIALIFFWGRSAR